MSVDTTDRVHAVGAEPGRTDASGFAFDEVPGKWPPRRTLLFVLVTCGGFWSAVIAGWLLLRA